MKSLLLYALVFLLLPSCNYVSYTPRSKKTIRRAAPSVLLGDRMVTFRQEQQRWPVSKEDFISKGKQYYQVFQGFPYTYTHFKIADSNNMTFYFSGHVRDNEEFDKTQKVNLNSLGGVIRFYKQNDRFIYKIKMN